MFQKRYRWVWKSYFSFQGNINLLEYRRRFLYINGVYLFGVVILFAILLPLHFVKVLNNSFVSIFIALFLIFYQFIFFYLIIAISVKRLHDVNKSGYWILTILVPVFGILLIIYWITRPSAAIRSELYPNNGQHNGEHR